MERLRFRSTSAIDLMAELRQEELLAEARQAGVERAAPRRRRHFLPLATRILGRRAG